MRLKIFLICILPLLVFSCSTRKEIYKTKHESIQVVITKNILAEIETVEYVRRTAGGDTTETCVEIEGVLAEYQNNSFAIKRSYLALNRKTFSNGYDSDQDIYNKYWKIAKQRFGRIKKLSRELQAARYCN
jgi:hypothetical protein